MTATSTMARTLAPRRFSLARPLGVRGAYGVRMPTAQEWLSAYADKLRVPMPSPEEIDAILALAGVAAHASERIAAPVACWMAAGSDVALEEARRLADELAD
jgi:hypothetical protein